MERIIFWTLKIIEVLGTAAILWLAINNFLIFLIILTIIMGGLGILAVAIQFYDVWAPIWIRQNKKWAKKIAKLLNHKEK